MIARALNIETIDIKSMTFKNDFKHLQLYLS